MKISVNPDNYPHVFTACTALALNNGVPYGQKRFYMPEGMPTDMLDRAERGLASLNSEELDTFVCGDNEEIKEIAKRSDDLFIVHVLLNAVFEEI